MRFLVTFLIVVSTTALFALNNGTEYKLVDENQLYKIAEDPFEKNNVAEEYPEIVQKYQTAFTKWYASCKNSFEGSEYGTTSLERVKQVYPERNPKRSDN